MRHALGVLLVLRLSACDLSDGGTGGGADEAIDVARLDRSEADGACGYPGPGSQGYGAELGHRLANFGQAGATMIIDCEGNAIELADLLCERSLYQAAYPSDASDYSGHNRAILLSIGAGWCEPCIEETEELMPDVYEPLHEQGLEIVQVLFQDDAAQAPTKAWCRQWRDESFSQPLRFFVLLDQTFSWADDYLLDPQASTPITMLIDANANIRYKVVGEKPRNLADEVRLVMADPYGD
jgi:hypothetical protein